ncbi:MAG TPA: NUDIX hydrolase [Candidatus Saccharimonadales bacterium]|nr:NUDIX hydrolase [Candidatus Saccharimonadales bacterium]
MELEVHDYQLTILKELLFKPGSRFSELNKVDVANDHFAFHVNKLVKEGLILKQNGRYTLTTNGKEFANRMDTDALQLERQGKLAVAIHAVRKNKGKTEYLIHRRLKEPFFGWYGSHSGKIRWGETPLQCAQREFMEEAGLSGDFTLKGIVHYHHFYKDGKFLEDKYFWIYKVENVKGKLIKKFEAGESIWMTEKEYLALPYSFATFEEMTEVLNSRKLVYLERQIFVENY